MLFALAVTSIVCSMFAKATTSVMVGNFLRWGFPIYGLFWFCFGIMLRRRKFLVRHLNGLGLLGLTVAVLVVVHLLPEETFFYFAMRFVVCCVAMAAVWWFVPAKKFPAILVHSTFAIYILHWQVICCVGHFTNGQCAMARSGIALLSGIAVPVFCAAIMKRFVPNAAKLVFGGR